MVVSNPRNMDKDSFKGTFFVMNKFPRKEPTNLRKFYDSKGTTKFPQSECLISRLWCKFYDQYSSYDILSQGHQVVVSNPCDIDKD